MRKDEFELYDLKVEVVHGDKSRPLVCRHKEGDTLILRNGGTVEFPNGTFGLYALLAVLPFLPSKQRPTQPADWMTSDAEIACTDPYCGARFRITRLETRTYRHGDTTKVPMAS